LFACPLHARPFETVDKSDFEFNIEFQWDGVAQSEPQSDDDVKGLPQGGVRRTTGRKSGKQFKGET
jgi:hypothetical protein